MIALVMLGAMGQAEQDALFGVATFGGLCALALMAVMAVVALGVWHDRRHGCKRVDGRPLSRRERAVLKELEAQGDLGNGTKGSGE